MYKNPKGKGYQILSDFMKDASVDDFKQHDNMTYAVEHINPMMIEYAKIWYSLIREKYDLPLDEIIKLIELNDKHGNPKKYFIHDDLVVCSPNSIKYIYFGLMTIKHMRGKEMNNFIEIGGGYGGQCLILLELFKFYNIDINKYVLIDLREVVEFQEKYLSLHNIEDRCIFRKFPDMDDLGSDNFLFSCYCFGEISLELREIYYHDLFPIVKNGFIVWNCSEIDLPIEYVSLEEFPQTGNNYFVYF